MEYDKEFEEFISGIPMSDAMRRNMQCAWQAARKDHYRIGEEVEARAHSLEGFGRGVVTAQISGGFAVVQPFNVRRITEKTRIDEIAEEAASHWEGGKEALEKAIKSVILQIRKEWEAER